MAAATLLTVAAALGCAREDDPTRPRPLKVFADAFETSPQQVVIEADGGTILGAYDAWLQLMPSVPLRPRFADEYAPIDCAAAKAYLQRELSLQGKDPGDLVLTCSGYSNARLPFDNGRWIAEDAATGRVYYRVWKYR